VAAAAGAGYSVSCGRAAHTETAQPSGLYCLLWTMAGSCLAFSAFYYYWERTTAPSIFSYIPLHFHFWRACDLLTYLSSSTCCHPSGTVALPDVQQQLSVRLADILAFTFGFSLSLAVGHYTALPARGSLIIPATFGRDGVHSTLPIPSRLLLPLNVLQPPSRPPPAQAACAATAFITSPSSCRA